ncbi:hypothetical protein Scep_002368 [Stephania cephalantha]|uniref:Uncharacterized protein n=1 Tax=Stephania cephalantha TaxID=152367 RepID=A0AAP0LBA7_9MAGN
MFEFEGTLFDVVEFTISRLNNLAVDMQSIYTPSLKLAPRTGCLQGNIGSDIQNEISRQRLDWIFDTVKEQFLIDPLDAMTLLTDDFRFLYVVECGMPCHVMHGPPRNSFQGLILVGIRFVVLVFFLSWRVKNPNKDAMWLWGMSVVCEIWFAFSWILDQLPKLNPVNRSTDLAALHEKFEQASPANPLGKSDLPGIDVFVSTADPEKEPPLVTANTSSPSWLSIIQSRSFVVTYQMMVALS